MSNIRPDPAAEDLGRTMIQMDDVHRTILAETLDDQDDGQIKESGRTLCPRGGQILGPGKKYPTAVELAGCPLERGGTWHTHVTPGQLRKPVNSLPDMANVVFGFIDASVVSGTEQAEAFVAADDPDQMVEAFQDALGARVESPEDVVDVIENGDISAPRARRRVRSAFSPLLSTKRTRFDDLTRRVRASGPLASAPSMSSAAGCTCHNAISPQNLTLRAEFRESSETMTTSLDEIGQKLSAQGIELGPLVISNAVGTVVGGVVDRFLFD